MSRVDTGRQGRDLLSERLEERPRGPCVVAPRRPVEHREAELSGQGEQPPVPRPEQLAAGVERQAAHVDAPRASTDPVPRLEHEHVGTGLREPPSGCQPGESRPHDDDLGVHAASLAA
jgi:hypothetical protein